MAKAWIGTSGWNYKHWRNGVFYPKDLKPEKWLDFYSRHFATVEINNSFYRLPSEEVFARWQEQAPENFTFAVKASRFLTHIKRLKEPEDPLDLFFSRAKHLKGTLGPVLFQLPPMFKADIDRLSVFLRALRGRAAFRKIRCALEIRDATWLEPPVFELLERHHVALCFADWRELHVTEPVTADFVYVRRHSGPSNGDYPKRDLDRDVRQIRGWLQKRLDVYVYFNNDLHGHAIRNAQYVQERLRMPGYSATRHRRPA
jgi:uncharacterized protein YecE (DUF72 family)